MAKSRLLFERFEKVLNTLLLITIQKTKKILKARYNNTNATLGISAKFAKNT